MIEKEQAKQVSPFCHPVGRHLEKFTEISRRRRWRRRIDRKGTRRLKAAGRRWRQTWAGRRRFAVPYVRQKGKIIPKVVVTEKQWDVFNSTLIPVLLITKFKRQIVGVDRWGVGTGDGQVDGTFDALSLADDATLQFHARAPSDHHFFRLVLERDVFPVKWQS